MAYFAKLDENNKVISVHRVDNENILLNGVEDEATGIAFLTKIHGYSNWKKTSYNTRDGIYYNEDFTPGDQTKAFRKNYAGADFTYDPSKDAFIPVKPFESWVLNNNTCLWEAPIPMPSTETDGKKDGYVWNENNLNWDKIVDKGVIILA